jgi:hypothetical protein
MALNRGLLNRNTGNRAIESQLANNFKWHAGKTELSVEDQLEQFVPRTAEKKKKIKNYLDYQIKTATDPYDNMNAKQKELLKKQYKAKHKDQEDPSEDALKLYAMETNNHKLNAWTFLEAQLKLNDVDGEIDEEFIRGFWSWLMGAGTIEEVGKTPWGRTPPYWDTEVKEYVMTFFNAFYDHKEELMRLFAKGSVNQLQGIDEFAKYYKFIVHGDFSKPPTGFLDDFMDGALEAGRLKQIALDRAKRDRADNDNRSPEVIASENNWLTSGDQEKTKYTELFESVGKKILAPLLIGNFSNGKLDGDNSKYHFKYSRDEEIVWIVDDATYEFKKRPPGIIEEIVGGIDDQLGVAGAGENQQLNAPEPEPNQPEPIAEGDDSDEEDAAAIEAQRQKEALLTGNREPPLLEGEFQPPPIDKDTASDSEDEEDTKAEEDDENIKKEVKQIENEPPPPPPPNAPGIPDAPPPPLPQFKKEPIPSTPKHGPAPRVDIPETPKRGAPEKKPISPGQQAILELRKKQHLDEDTHTPVKFDPTKKPTVEVPVPVTPTKGLLDTINQRYQTSKDKIEGYNKKINQASQVLAQRLNAVEKKKIPLDEKVKERNDILAKFKEEFNIDAMLKEYEDELLDLINTEAKLTPSSSHAVNATKMMKRGTGKAVDIVVDVHGPEYQSYALGVDILNQILKKEGSTNTFTLQTMDNVLLYREVVDFLAHIEKEDDTVFGDNYYQRIQSLMENEGLYHDNKHNITQENIDKFRETVSVKMLLSDTARLPELIEHTSALILQSGLYMNMVAQSKQFEGKSQYYAVAHLLKDLDRIHKNMNLIGAQFPK